MSRFRPIIIAALAIICAGLILFSVLTIKYPVGKSLKTELAVTELSLTHDILRGKDGKLTTPADIAAAAGKKPPKKGKACPT